MNDKLFRRNVTPGSRTFRRNVTLGRKYAIIIRMPQVCDPSMVAYLTACKEWGTDMVLPGDASLMGCRIASHC